MYTYMYVYMYVYIYIVKESRGYGLKHRQVKELNVLVLKLC